MVSGELPTVYAYRDQGPLLQVETRWNPRVVACTAGEDHSDLPGTPYGVKFRQGVVGSAALISEVVSHALLQALNLPTLDAALVQISPELAASYQASAGVAYEVVAGLHFGTVRRLDIFPGPAESWEQLAEPAEVARIWAADCWLMNLDRDTYGNAALTSPDSQGRFHLSPVDHSDCFLGSTSLSDGTFLTRSRSHGPAPYPRYLERVLTEQGPQVLYDMVHLIEAATAATAPAIARVPGEWWSEAKVNPDDVQRCLQERAARAREILQVEHWENVSYATAGGKLFQQL